MPQGYGYISYVVQTPSIPVSNPYNIPVCSSPLGYMTIGAEVKLTLSLGAEVLARQNKEANLPSLQGFCICSVQLQDVF